MSIHTFPANTRSGGLTTGTQPPDNGSMETRVTNLEVAAQDTRDRLVRIESRLENFERNYATKEDLHKELHSMTWRIIGACALLVAMVYFIALNVKP